MLVLFLLKLAKQNLQVDTVKNVLTVVVQEKMVVVHTVAVAENVLAELIWVVVLEQMDE